MPTSLRHRALAALAALAALPPRAGADPVVYDPKPCAACHAAVTARKNQHPALDAGNGCSDCHQPAGAPGRCKDPVSSGWRLAEKVPALCYGCHDRQDGAPFVHGAVLLGRCTTCHDPHSSDEPKLLRAGKAAELCFRCHADDVTGRAHVHGPVGDGDCLACHGPHGGPVANDLKEAVPGLCTGCHDAVLGGKHVHAAVSRWGCTACHDPHASPNDLQLLALPNALCVRCHGAIGGEHVFVAFDGRPHPLEGKPDPSRPGKPLACTSCHDPHASDQEHLLRRGPTKDEVCNACHAKH